MSDVTQAMLFCPPLPPFRLEGDGPFTLGRQSACEITVQHGDVSRQHARLRRSGDGYAIEDLASTNGTFVNGRRIESETSVRAGDRIELGTMTLTFCEVEGGIGGSSAMDGSQTIIVDRMPTHEAFSGDLAELPPFAVLQVLEMGAKSGILEIRAPDHAGKLWFKQGRPVHAETEKQNGFEAALEMVNASTGEFTFSAEFVKQEPSMQCSVTEILLEASRAMDEAER